MKKEFLAVFSGFPDHHFSEEITKRLREELIRRDIRFKLVDSSGNPIPEEKLHVPHYREKCCTCSFQILCNGCFECGACEN